MSFITVIVVVQAAAVILNAIAIGVTRSHSHAFTYVSLAAFTSEPIVAALAVTWAHALVNVVAIVVCKNAIARYVRSAARAAKLGFAIVATRRRRRRRRQR